MSKQPPDHAKALEARKMERYLQSKARIDVAEGRRSVEDVIYAAAFGKYGRYLLGIPLRQLLLDQPGWGEKRADAAVKRVVEFSGSATPERPNIAWLLDPRCSGARYIAWCDVLYTSRTDPPWAGFPFTAPPNITQYRDVHSLRKDTGQTS